MKIDYRNVGIHEYPVVPPGDLASKITKWTEISRAQEAIIHRLMDHFGANNVVDAVKSYIDVDDFEQGWGQENGENHCPACYENDPCPLCSHLCDILEVGPETFDIRLVGGLEWNESEKKFSLKEKTADEKTKQDLPRIQQTRQLDG